MRPPATFGSNACRRRSRSAEGVLLVATRLSSSPREWLLFAEAKTNGLTHGNRKQLIASLRGRNGARLREHLSVSSRHQTLNYSGRSVAPDRGVDLHEFACMGPCAPSAINTSTDGLPHCGIEALSLVDPVRIGVVFRVVDEEIAPVGRRGLPVGDGLEHLVRDSDLKKVVEATFFDLRWRLEVFVNDHRGGSRTRTPGSGREDTTPVVQPIGQQRNKRRKSGLVCTQ